MTGELDVQRLIANPGAGWTVEWWRVVEGGHTPSIVHLRAVFHVDTPWEDYPGGDGRKGGAPFQNEWAIERWDESTQRWSCTGRADRGWMEANVRGENVFLTQRAAAEEARWRATSRVTSHRSQIDQLQAAIAGFDRLLAGSFDEQRRRARDAVSLLLSDPRERIES